MGDNVPWPWSEASHFRAAETTRIWAIRNDGAFITIYASGILPNVTDVVSIVQRPERVNPPWYEVRIERGEISLPALAAFNISAVIPYPEDDVVVVFDATGRHEIPIT